MNELVWLVTGIVVGGIAAWFIAKFKFSGNNSSNSELKLEKERVVNLRIQNGEFKKELSYELDRVITIGPLCFSKSEPILKLLFF